MAQEPLLTAGQVTFFVMYGWAVCLWLVSEFLYWTRKPQHDHGAAEGDVEDMKVKREGLPLLQAEAAEGNGHAAGEPKTFKSAVSSTGSMLSDIVNSSFARCVMFDLDAIVKERLTLRAMSEFGTLMFWYFICDRTSFFQEGTKSYNRDLFMFLFVILTCVAFGSSLQTIKAPVLLNRQQTEEWKGWMQVLFLLYHYFEAKEIYNAIRIFIAGYVWMTGFGNFSYYYKTNDFSIGRFGQMMWRLNFLVFFACLVLRNSYMLYYICPMHTIFTIMVYACLGIASHLNQSKLWIWMKMVACVAVIYVFWDIKPVFYAIWSPLRWLVGYVDPRKPNEDFLYEWYFRSSLDRYVWIYGMICAFLHPYFSSLLTQLDNMPPVRKQTMRAAVVAGCGVVGYFWYTHVYVLPRQEYNKIHPYTSWIPITLFAILRNMTPPLRLHHMRLYGWLGCITLETYICQFHIWLKTSMPDGQPKGLLSIVPGYPLINFAVCSAAYVFISFRLFELTNALKNVVVPHSNNQMLLRNTIILAIFGALLYFACYGVLGLVLTHVL